MPINLGRLEKVTVRDVWESESQDFTPWLARTENLAVLADALDMELEIEAQEKNVGPFRADILCKDLTEGSWVLIENQLERTDHSHLGQLLTYSAGLHAVNIVWVATQFTDEHRAALDWLNEITDEKFRFFGLEVELWKIGSSAPAPKFNVISKPNDWTRSVLEAARRIDAEDLTDKRALQLKYWMLLKTRLENHPFLRLQKPSPKHWSNLSIGRSGCHLAATINSRESRLGVELYLSDENAKAFFHLLKREQAAIEQELRVNVEWMELPVRRACRIVHYRTVPDPLDENMWPEYQTWMIEILVKFNAVFRQRIRILDPHDYVVGAAQSD